MLQVAPPVVHCKHTYKLSRNVLSRLFPRTEPAATHFSHELQEQRRQTPQLHKHRPAQQHSASHAQAKEDTSMRACVPSLALRRLGRRTKNRSRDSSATRTGHTVQYKLLHEHRIVGKRMRTGWQHARFATPAACQICHSGSMPGLSL